MKVTCIKCLKNGTLCLQIRTIRGDRTEYYYVMHEDPNEACSLGPSDALPHAYKDQLKTYTYFGSQLKKIASENRISGR